MCIPDHGARNTRKKQKEGPIGRNLGKLLANVLVIAVDVTNHEHWHSSQQIAIQNWTPDGIHLHCGSQLLPVGHLKCDQEKVQNHPVVCLISQNCNDTISYELLKGMRNGTANLNAIQRELGVRRAIHHSADSNREESQ